MVVIGAGGHAKEIYDLLVKNKDLNGLYFFDSLSKDLPDLLFDKHPLIRSFEELEKQFKIDSRFVLGMGNPAVRKKLTDKCVSIGGELTSIISNTATIGTYKVTLHKGLNIMHGVVITNEVIIGEGTLINANATIHHDCIIGQYCEISPSASITGNVKIGDFCSIGTGAVILPKVKIGNHVTVGAGAVVTKDIGENQTYIGVPAKKAID